jgi:UPF0716 family protein affecting phage T7 exclusion
MANDTGLWTWPVDVAATRSGVARLVGASSVLYLIGALLLLTLPGVAGTVGALLLLLGVAGCVFVLGKVIAVRRRSYAD